MGECPNPFVQIAPVLPDFMETGMIIMWGGSVATIPAGWILCDGTGGSPDLRDKFIVGAKQDDLGIAKSNITGALLQEGGDTSHCHTSGSLIDGDSDDNVLVCNTPEDESVATAAHSHGISGSVAVEDHIPTFYALCYIYKT